MSTMEMTRAEQVEAQRNTRFFERLLEGCGPLNAAIEVGWTPKGLEKRMADPDFADLVHVTRERLIEGVEETVWTKAREGIRWAAQMVLYNQRSSQWKDVRHIKMDRAAAIDPSVVVSVKQAMLEMMRADAGSIEAMQPEAIETTATDVD